jgi:hypothetical protein
MWHDGWKPEWWNKKRLLHISTTMNQYATIEELLETVFSVWSAYQRTCRSLPQWNECYPISAHHGGSNAHWFARRLVTIYKDADLWHASISHSYTYINRTLIILAALAADSASDHQRSSGQPALPSLEWANHCSRSFASQLASPSLVLASPLWQELCPAFHRRADSQSPSCHQEYHQNLHRLAGCDESFARHPAGTPGFWQTTLFRANNITTVTSSGQPATKGVLTVFIRHALLPCSSVIFNLTAITICYSFTWLSLRASTSHRCLLPQLCFFNLCVQFLMEALSLLVNRHQMSSTWFFMVSSILE